MENSASAPVKATVWGLGSSVATSSKKPCEKAYFASGPAGSMEK
jgi:hypothetical protein